MDSAKYNVKFDEEWEWPPAEKATKTVVTPSRRKKKKSESLKEITISDLEQDKLIYNLELKVNRLMDKP